MHLVLLLLQLIGQLIGYFLLFHRMFAVQSLLLFLLLQFHLVQELLLLVELRLQIADLVLAAAQFLVQLIERTLVQDYAILLAGGALAFLVVGGAERCVLHAQFHVFAFEIDERHAEV